MIGRATSLAPNGGMDPRSPHYMRRGASGKRRSLKGLRPITPGEEQALGAPGVASTHDIDLIREEPREDQLADVDAAQSARRVGAHPEHERVGHVCRTLPAEREWMAGGIGDAKIALQERERERVGAAAGGSPVVSEHPHRDGDRMRGRIVYQLSDG